MSPCKSRSPQVGCCSQPVSIVVERMSTRACLLARTKESLFDQRPESRGVAENPNPIQSAWIMKSGKSLEIAGRPLARATPARRCAGLILKKIVADEPVSRKLARALQTQ